MVISDEELKRKVKSLALDNIKHKTVLRMINKKLLNKSYVEEFRKHRESRKETQLIQEILRLRRELRRKEAAIEVMMRAE